MTQEIKNNNVSLKSLISGTSYLFLENITLSSMPLGQGFLFRSIQPFIFVSDYIEIKQLKEALMCIIKSLTLNFVIHNRSMCRVMLLD